MKVKPVIPRRRAEEDIAKALEYYLEEAGSDAALALVDSVEQAVKQISRQPKGGSPSYAERLEIPGLRSWKTKGFPYLMFYIDVGTHIEVWRVLHDKMDIPAWLQGEA